MAAPPRRIFLVGLSGSGKSTAGKIAAETLGWSFVDTDREVEVLAGREVSLVFAVDGELAFREAEAEVIGAAARLEDVVIATGGGAIGHADSRAAIASGVVVWLDVSPACAASRLQADPATENRPLLAGDPAGRLQQLFWEREEFYRRADFTIDVDDRTPEQTAAAILACWERARAGQAPDPTFAPARMEAS
jgi:shikimate kinase